MQMRKKNQKGCKRKEKDKGKGDEMNSEWMKKCKKEEIWEKRLSRNVTKGIGKKEKKKKKKKNGEVNKRNEERKGGSNPV